MKEINTESFIEEGFLSCPQMFPPGKLEPILKAVYKTRKITECFTEELFLTEEEFLADPQMVKTNPGPGQNLTEEVNLDAIEKDKTFVSVLEELLGKDYVVLHKKFVVGVPDQWMPQWLRIRLKDLHAKNLGPYIKKKYRDITYFNGIDFHQDVLDYSNEKARPNSFIVVYVYFDEVTENHSPLHVVPKSHKFGASLFPHQLDMNIDKQELFYCDRKGQEGTFAYKVLTGNPGDVNIWHALTLHGTRPTSASIPRVSLRYMIEKNPENKAETIIDRTNAEVNGPLVLVNQKKRDDTDGKGNFVDHEFKSQLHNKKA